MLVVVVVTVVALVIKKEEEEKEKEEEKQNKKANAIETKRLAGCMFPHLFLIFFFFFLFFLSLSTMNALFSDALFLTALNREGMIMMMFPLCF